MNVDLVLQPAADRNRSMVLYAERLAANQPTEQTWTVRRLPSLPTGPGARIAEIALTPAAMKLTRADLVHIVDHAHAAYLKYSPVPGVVTVHDLIPLKLLRGEYAKKATMSKRSERWFRWNIGHVAKAAHVVCPSQATANDVKRLLNVDATVIPNGIDQLFFETPADSNQEIVSARLANRPGPILLQVTSGFFYKNETAFMQIFMELAKTIAGLTWVRLGSPFPDKDLATLNQAGLSEQIIDYGSVPVGQIAALYRTADCLLFPSWDEGFGWPPLEAMAASCPVVSSNGGALAETASSGALCAAPDDIPALTNHVRSILTDPACADECRERGLEHASKYTWQKTAAAFSDIYAGSLA